MKEIIHFGSSKERIAYLRGGYEEIIPVEAETKPSEPDNIKTDFAGNSQNKGSNGKKRRKGKKKDEIQAE